MAQELCIGNQAMAFAALKAGINVAAGYPGTPSSEILETIAEQVRLRNLSNLHVEWSTNEKAALEVGAGASFAGARALVTMKQVGLNVASDALMTLPYLGVSGGLVLVVADDPGPISSQTEQDTRQFAAFAKVPVLDPSTPEEAYKMILSAFDISERYKTPVIVRPTTRICHGAAPVDIAYDYIPHTIDGFKRSPDWVIFPRRSYRGHLEILERLPQVAEEFNSSPYNTLINTHATAPAHQGIVAGGISYAYVHDALKQLKDLASIRLFKLGTPFPFPEQLAFTFLEGIRELLVFEELEPVLEREFLQLVGKRNLRVKVLGKLNGFTSLAGENSVNEIARQIEVALCSDFLPKPIDVTPRATAPAVAASAGATAGAAAAGAAAGASAGAAAGASAGAAAGASTGAAAGASASTSASSPVTEPELPPRPPVLCAGCPHRASFYAVKQALRGRPAVFSGDIGCYTLGNALPLDMVDTCICMGGGFTVPQGMSWAEPDVLHLGFVGDSTFFASSLTGVVNAVYNRARVTLCVLDNSTTAMTGSQPHPGTGVRVANSGTATAGEDMANALCIPEVLRALGVAHVAQVNPFSLESAQLAVARAVEYDGVSAVVFEAPCITVARAKPLPVIDKNVCIGCKKCIQAIGCPALVYTSEKRMSIDSSLCYGCNLCVYVCPSGAIIAQTGGEVHE